MLPINYLFESTPSNPDDVILMNIHYPKGLTHGNIYNYYTKHKDKILNQIKNREIFFFFLTGLNYYIVKRKHKGKLLRLTKSNYDKHISGRTLSLISSNRKMEDYGIIDIDYHNFEIAKETTINVYNHLNDLKFFKDIKIRYTGKQSFHIFCYFKNKTNIDKIRHYLKELLRYSHLSKSYSVGGKRSDIIPNLDLSSNKYRGGFVCLHALSADGLRCMEIDINSLPTFKKEMAKI